MNEYAIVADGVVVNLIIWDGVSPWTPPDGTTLVAIQADEWVDMGATFDPIAIPRFT